MKVSDKLLNNYSDYYEQEHIRDKRALAAAQTVKHIKELAPDQVENLIDIGAGEGAVLNELDRCNYALNLHATEISDSGIAAMKRRQISRLQTIQKFDGYSISGNDNTFDFGTAIHVLEHVEHERAFLAEITRVCKKVYIEVPLEMTMRIEKSIRASGPFGHINFYNPASFRNLLETSDLEVLNFQIFSNSLAYEQHVSGKFYGKFKHVLRTKLLSFFPNFAPLFMTYLAGAVCKKKPG